MRRMSACLLLFLGGTLGCSQQQPESPRTFEIQHEGVHYCGLLWTSGENVLMVCPGQVRSSSASDTVNGPPWVRTIDLKWTLQDGASVHWHFDKTNAGMSCKFNDQPLDLQKGHFIRVTTQPDKKAEFTQHKVDLSKLQPTAASCVELSSAIK
jgi:hypothetical protein